MRADYEKIRDSSCQQATESGEIVLSQSPVENGSQDRLCRQECTG